MNSGFQTQVQKSSENAELVLKTVPDIENQIRDVDDVVREAENVSHTPKIAQNQCDFLF